MRRLVTIVALLAALATAIAALSGTVAESENPARTPREIVLVARGMAFYLEDEGNVPNPTIQVSAGSRMRVVLRNEEPGIAHSFAVPAWGVETRLLQGAGSDTILVEVPAKPGRYDYRCTPHAAMMRGTIEIR